VKQIVFVYMCVYDFFLCMKIDIYRVIFLLEILFLLIFFCLFVFAKQQS